LDRDLDAVHAHRLDDHRVGQLSESQLRSITWAEITKWLAMSLNSHWFEVSATRLMPAKWLTELVERDLKKGTRYWGVEGGCGRPRILTPTRVYTTLTV
jgi:hypothetical protein